MGNNRSDLGNQPFYDYKARVHMFCSLLDGTDHRIQMIDTGQSCAASGVRAAANSNADLFLLPTLEQFFLNLPQGSGRAPAFLAQNATLQNGTYGELLNRSASLISKD